MEDRLVAARDGKEEGVVIKEKCEDPPGAGTVLCIACGGGYKNLQKG